MRGLQLLCIMIALGFFQGNLRGSSRIFDQIDPEKIYKNFLDCIEQGRLVLPKDSNAYYFYVQYPTTRSFEKNRTTMKSLLLNELMRMPKIGLEQYLKNEKEALTWLMVDTIVYYLEHVTLIIDKNDFSYEISEAQKYFFKGVMEFFEDVISLDKAQGFLKKSMALNSEVAYPYNELGNLYWYMGRLDEAKEILSNCSEIGS